MFKPLSLIRNSLGQLRMLIYKIRLKNLGRNALIEAGVHLHYKNRISIGSGCRIASHATLRANSELADNIHIGNNSSILESALINSNQGYVHIGEKSWLGPFCLIYGNGGVSIGNNVLIAAHTSINTVSHQHAQTDKPINEQGTKCDKVIIEDDVWVGLHVVILQGVCIGRGSIIGAGAVVTKDIPPYSIAMGIPAKVVRSREHQKQVEC